MTLSKKAEQTRQHILDTGFELVLHKGFVGVGLQEILKTSGEPYRVCRRLFYLS